MPLMTARELRAKKSYHFSLKERGEAHLNQNTGLHANDDKRESGKGKIHKDMPTMSNRQPGVST